MFSKVSRKSIAYFAMITVFSAPVLFNSVIAQGEPRHECKAPIACRSGDMGLANGVNATYLPSANYGLANVPLVKEFEQKRVRRMT
jgi:hypothetical protein